MAAPGRNGAVHATRGTRILPAMLVADGSAVVLAMFLAFTIRIQVAVPFTEDFLPADRLEMLPGALSVGLFTQLPLLYLFGLYDEGFLRRRREPLVSVGLAVLIQLLLISAWYFFRLDLDFPRSVLLLFAALNLAFVSLSRLFAFRRLSGPDRVVRLAIVGAESEILALQEMLVSGAVGRSGVEIVGAVRSDGPARPGERVGDSQLVWLGTMTDLEREVRAGRVDRVIVAPAESWKDEILEGVLRATAGTAAAPGVAVVPSVHELLVGRLTSLSVEDVPLIDVVRAPGNSLSFALKPVLDTVVAALLLAASLPVLAVAAGLIRISSRGPVFFRQRRVGRAGEEFLMYKLRTMQEGAEVGVGPVLAQPDDERVLPVGRFLRATRIDEIPQLLNVLNGSMSLVGPRPERPEITERLASEIPGYTERWLVKPGVSGLAQVRGEYHTSPSYKLKYDLAYIHNHSLLLDLRIMAETLRTLLSRSGV